MASSSSSFAPNVSSHSWKYHVFLSFRGEDVRKTFVDHLYSVFLQQGIHTYKDDETLPRGELVGPHLENAIEESQVVAIIFSQNYADSSWCLGELAHAMKSRVMRGNTLLPIFYDVDPSTVRNVRLKYGEAFTKHELKNKDKCQSWRQALVDASNISGWEIKNMANGHEAKAIKEIVDIISRILHPLISSVDEKLIGIHARIQDLISRLEIGSGGVRMIEILGVGGGGKTTLALSVYREISSKFNGCYFMENIREESNKNGLVNLQEKVISNILTQKGMGVNNIRGRWLPNDRLCCMKLLIVLDDVDHLDQLRLLVGSHDWFGVGNRIIITTRDEHLLTAHRVNVIYNIRLLNDDEAIKLFEKHAPRDNMPMKDYEELCQDVILYAYGLPLALIVLGCFLCDKDINEWRSTLASLKEIPETDIVEKLKISYDGLTLVEQELFLDIACFYRGEYKNEMTMARLDAFGFHPVRGVKVLIQKALITISDGRFDMHDLVQEMGHYIVRGKHPNNPKTHSRVWKKEDVFKICAMDATEKLGMIEAIQFDSSNRYGEIEILPPIVSKMKNLRWFDLASPFPTISSSTELCYLRLMGISQKQLWNGYKRLRNLKIMELVGLDNLLSTPDFNGLPNLERFSLYGCRRLKRIDPSIGHLQKLVFLSIKGCSSLKMKMFPPITQLRKLETLSFEGCIDLYKESLIDFFQKSLIYFFLYCWMNYDTQLSMFHTCLRKLDLSLCNLGDNDTGSAVWELPTLEELNLTRNRFTRLNFSLLQLPRLKWLNVSSCTELVELLEVPSSIAVVIADHCLSLKSFGDISKCKWLWKVSVLGDNKLGPHGGDILLDSMLQGNAPEKHFISFRLQQQKILKQFLGRLYRGKTFTMRLPGDWYNDFCGFLICFVSRSFFEASINIVMKQEPNEYSPSELWHESSEAMYPKYEIVKYVGYVSFSSLRLLNSSDNIISFSVEANDVKCVGAELIPRKSKANEEVQAPDCSEFWDKEREHGTTFTIQHDSRSSVKIFWTLGVFKSQRVAAKMA